MIEIEHGPSRDLVTIRAAGRLTAEDYDRALPELETAITNAEGKLNAVIRLEDLQGWDPVALWKDLKFDVRHYNDFERIAVVGETTSESWIARLSSVATAAEMRFFERGEEVRAQDWALSGQDARGATGEARG